MKKYSSFILLLAAFFIFNITAGCSQKPGDTGSSSSGNSSSSASSVPSEVLAEYMFDDSNNAVSNADANISAAPVTNNGLSAITYYSGNPGTGSAIACNTWWTNTPDQYFQFTLTPVGTNINLTYMQFDAMRSSTGPAVIAVRSSRDFYLNNIAVATNVTSFTNSPMNSIDISSLSGISSSITIRIYGFNATGAGGTFRIDNVVFLGNKY